MTAWAAKKGAPVAGSVSGEQVLRGLKGDSLAPAYFIGGESPWLRERIMLKLKELSIPESWRATCVETLWAGEASEADAADTAATPPFGSPRRFLLVRAMEEFRPRKKGARKASTTPADSPLASYLRSPSPTTVLVMVSETRTLEAWEGDPILKAVRGTGVIVQCDAPEKWDLRNWVERLSAEAGLKLAAGVAEEMAERSGGDQLRLEREVEKMAVWAGPNAGPITREQVELLAGESAPPTVFQFLDMLFVDRNPGKALAMLAQLLFDMHVLQLHAMMTIQLRKLISLKQAVREDWGAGRIAKELKLPYGLVDRLTMMVNRTPPERFAELLGALARAEADLKRSDTTRGRRVLEKFVLEVCEKG